MALTWAALRWTKLLIRSSCSLNHYAATCTRIPQQPSRPSILIRYYTAINRCLDVLSPTSKPLQVSGANSPECQPTARPLLAHNCTAVCNNAQPCRLTKRGMEYQPSNRKRKTKHGLHARLKKKSGLKLIMRRILKGRYLLTH